MRGENEVKRLNLVALVLALVLAFVVCGGGNSSVVQTAKNQAPSLAGSLTPEQTGREEHIYSESEDSEDFIPDLPPWNGFDFGPNLTYSEEYELASDAGDYLNAFVAAKVVFEMARDNGNVPEYSDDTEYTMVLVGLEAIEGTDQECYLYRLDVAEPTGTIGAAYAYGYQSGNIYMQGFGEQFVLILHYSDFLPH